MKIQKILYLILILACFIFCINKTSAIPNPWTECGNDIYCAANIAGFNLPLRVNNYSVRAMADMIEITFPLNKKKTVTIRKSVLYKENADEHGIKDISGDYNNYSVNKTIWLEQSIPFKVKGNKDKYYVVNFAAETGYYCFICKKGLSLNDIKYLYNLIKEAEAPRQSFEEQDNYTIEQLQDLRRVDGIVEPVYTQDCFPRTLQKRGVTQNCFERVNLGQDIFCSASEIEMIKEYYIKGQNTAPLNNGSGQFCAI